MTSTPSPSPAPGEPFNYFESVSKDEWVLHQGQVVAIDKTVGGIAKRSDGTQIVGDSHLEVHAMVMAENANRAEPLDVTLFAVPRMADMAALGENYFPELMSTRELVGDVLSDS